MTFTMTHTIFGGLPCIYYDGEMLAYFSRGRKGSTMDDRWFYHNHVAKLCVGQSVETDFQTITRVN